MIHRPGPHPVDEHITVRLTERRAEVVKHIGNAIGHVLSSRQNLRRDRWVLEELMAIVELMRIRASELCAQGLLFSEAETFARKTMVSAYRKSWLET